VLRRRVPVQQGVPPCVGQVNRLARADTHHGVLRGDTGQDIPDRRHGHVVHFDVVGPLRMILLKQVVAVRQRRKRACTRVVSKESEKIEVAAPDTEISGHPRAMDRKAEQRVA
jgi:hypothetical protein